VQSACAVRCRGVPPRAWFVSRRYLRNQLLPFIFDTQFLFNLRDDLQRRCHPTAQLARAGHYKLEGQRFSAPFGNPALQSHTATMAGGTCYLEYLWSDL
jgi:hypothetical protein